MTDAVHAPLAGQTAGSKPRFLLLALILVLIAGLHFRVTTVIGTEVEGPLRADAGQYFAYAYNLRHHGVYSNDVRSIGTDAAPAPDHFRNPGYSLLLLPFAGSLPSDATLLKSTLLQAALSLLVVVFIFLAARGIMPAGGALAVALLTAVSPHLINANVYILSETLASFTTVLFLLALIRCGGKGSGSGSAALPWLGCGILLALSTLVRPTMQWFLLPVLVLVWALPAPGTGRRLAGFALGFVLAMAPWWLRNLLQFGQLSDPTLMISTLQHGMYPGFLYDGRPETFGFPYRFDPRTAEITQSLGSVLAEISRRFAEQPLEHLNWFLVGKPLMFWNWDNYAQGAGDVFIYPVTKTPFLTSLPLFAIHEAMYWLHWPLVTLGMAGSLLCWLPRVAGALGGKSAWAFRASGALLLYFVVLHMVGAPFPRYSIPILPILYLQAVGAILMLYRLLKPASP